MCTEINVCKPDGVLLERAYGVSEDLLEGSSIRPCKEASIPPFPNLMKEAREMKQISQKTLSQKSGLTNVQISRLESKKCSPSIRTLAKLAPFLGYCLEDLLLSASYSGTVESDKPTYTDTDGNVIDLQQEMQNMYRIDGELLLLFIKFFKHYTLADGELLKIILQNIEEYRGLDLSESQSDEMPKKADTAKKEAYAELFDNLKRFLISFDKAKNAMASVN